VATAEVELPELPFFVQADVGDQPMYYSAADFRRFMHSFLARTGVLGGNHFWISQADVVGFAVKIHSGFARVGGIGYDYLVHLPTDQTITLTGFATNPPAVRWHYVYLAVYDKLYGGVDDYTSKIVIVEDTGTGGGPAPADATATLYLGSIEIAPGQSNVQNRHISNDHQHGGTQGGYQFLSGFLTSAYASADTTFGTAPFRARYEGGTIRLGGAIKRVDGAVFPGNASYVIGTLPGDLRPRSTRVLTCPCAIREPQTATDGTYTCRLRIDPDGTMTIQMPVENAPKTIFFDGVTYDLD